MYSDTGGDGPVVVLLHGVLTSGSLWDDVVDGLANLVLVSCEAFDNYPPGLPGRLLCLDATLLGGTFLTAQLLRPRRIRHLPVTFGGMSAKRVPDEVFLDWIGPLRHDRRVRRDLDKYLRRVPKRAQLLEWAQEQRSFGGAVLVV